MLMLLALMFAQPADGTIVVTGQRPEARQELEKKAAQFVRGAAVSDAAGQLARRSRYCPRVIGLPDPVHVRRVMERVAIVGDAAGLPRPRAECRPDLLIVFTDDGDKLLGQLERGNARLFAPLDGAKQRELFNSGRAVRWWYANVTGGADGASQIQPALLGDAKGSIAVQQLNVWTSSLISTNIRTTINGTIVVVDVARATGHPLDAIADYAAMVSFAQINGRQDFAGQESVLALFARGPDQSRGGLTGWDIAYLRALYGLPLNRAAWSQRNALADALVRAVAQD